MERSLSFRNSAGAKTQAKFKNRTTLLRTAVFAVVLCVLGSFISLPGRDARAANDTAGPTPTRVIFEENFDSVPDGKLPEGW